MLQAVLGMMLVLGLIFLCAWLARRFGLQRFGGAQVVKVISSSMVGQRERVVVVEVGSTWLVLGVTAHQVSSLHTLPAQALPAGHEHSAVAAHKMAHLFAGKLREAVSGRPQGI
jgi:flagellar protein FliO/FliZ